MKRTLSVLLTMVLMLGVVPMTDKYQVEAESPLKKASEYLIPKPQTVKQNGGEVALNELKLEFDSNVDEDVRNKASNIFKEAGIKLSDTAGFVLYVTVANGEQANFKDLTANHDFKDISEKGKEAYQLLVGDDQIIINGSDQVGAFYALSTLKQLIDNQKIEKVDIIDYPIMPVRGVVEGFYGTPWTSEERKDQFRFYGDMKLNTYIYAPKDDPYHRDRWREPYPENELERMTALIETAKENKVNFVFAISPGIDIDLSGSQKEDDFQALLNKTQTLYDMGVRSFAIYFDDISNKDGVNQAKLLNRFQDEFVNKYDDVEPLITVPTEYDTFGMIGHGPISEYTKDFSETLEDDIHVMWTGSVVVSETLTTENAEFVHNIYGDNIAIWWNYPVNDYQKEKLALGPIVDIDKDVHQYVDYFLMNPMEHAYLSKIAVGTGADFSWNPESYNDTDSWLNILDVLYGELSEPMKIFTEHSSRMNKAWDVGRLEAQELQADIMEYWKRVGKGDGIEESYEHLMMEFQKMIDASEILLKELPQEILQEGQANIKKLGLLGKVAQKALEMNQAQNNEDVEAFEKLKREILQSNYNRGVQLSDRVVVDFIDETLNFNPLPSVGFDISSNFVNVDEKITLTNLSSIVTQDITWEFEGAVIHDDNKDSPVISYPKEGRYTVKLLGENSKGQDELIKEDFITVSEIAEEEKINLALEKDTTVSSTCAPNEEGKYAVDGNYQSKWCANRGWNHYITIDLGEPSLVTSITIHHAEAGGEPKASNTRAYSLSLSQDGENFTPVVDVKDNTAGITTDHIPAQEAQYLRLDITKPTQGLDNAARIFEIEVMGYEGQHKLPPSYAAVDMSELKKLVDSLSSLKREDYTPETWEMYEFVYQYAQSILEENIASQEEIDATVETLKEASKTLVKRANKDILYEILESFKTLDEEIYSSESYARLEKKISEANSTIEDDNASQENVDRMIQELKQTYEELVYIKELQDLINEVKGEALDNFTEESVQLFQEALKDAEKLILQDPSQKEVNEALTKLREAHLMLEVEKIELDFSSLDALVEEYSKLYKENYTEDTWEHFEKLLAETVEIKKTAENQDEIDAFVIKLQEAYELLVEKTPEPVDPEPVDPEPVDPEPVDPEPVDPEPVDPEPVDPEPVDPEPVDPEPVNPSTPKEEIEKDVGILPSTGVSSYLPFVSEMSILLGAYIYIKSKDD